MELNALGFDSWFEQQSAPLLQPGHSLARVTTVERCAFLIRNLDGEMSAELAGKLRFTTETANDMPCVGDWVMVQYPTTAGGPATIHGVVPRKTILRRKSSGKTVDFQTIAANLDAVFIMQACGFDFNPARLDRYLVMANESGIEPWIILTKTDLISPEQLEELIAELRRTRTATQILALSNTTGAGLDEFRALLVPGGTYCLLGSSGVGKSTLVNRLIGHDALDTRAVSATGEGVHTTSRRQLLVLENGAMLIDTPGMRELGMLGTSDGVQDTFAEIGEYAGRCRFTDCTHVAEPGCAVLQAVKDGALSADRHQSYLKLRKETEFHDLSSLDKRRKDRSFGRFIRSAKKGMKG